MKSKARDCLRSKKLLETNAVDFLAVLKGTQVSVIAQRGINWTHCKSCGHLLHCTDDRNAKPQICAGRKP